MNKAEKALYELNEMDELANGNSLIHHFSALVKLLITIIYILTVMSFDRYNLSGLIIMAIYPYILFQISGLSFTGCLYKLRFVLPLVLAIGIFNPLLDRNVFTVLAGIPITFGWISFFTIAVKGILAISASYLLMATTKIDAICKAMRKLHIPSIITVLLLLTYRYVSLMVGEVSIMTNAYHLRAPDQKGIHYTAWGSFLGQLLLRSMDKAKELYNAMMLRGYQGEFYYVDDKPLEMKDIVYFLIWIILFWLCRSVNVVQWIGRMFVR